MDAWSLPTSLNVAGKEYPIRSDYRVVLDILQCMNDPEIFEPDMTEDEKRAEQVISMLAILYIDFDDMPPTEWEEAAEKACEVSALVDFFCILRGDRRRHVCDRGKYPR